VSFVIEKQVEQAVKSLALFACILSSILSETGWEYKVSVGILCCAPNFIWKFDFEIYIFTISVVRITTATGKDGIEIMENMDGFLLKYRIQ